MTATRAREQLERILASPGFRASARSRRFLEYVVEETLAGRADRLKGLTIAIDVFGRDATMDRQHDPVVRIEAAKLRRSLERYYQTAGAKDPIRIDIPKGGYVPQFHDQDSSLDPTGPPAEAGRRRIWVAATVAGCAIAALTVAAASSSWLNGTSADRDATPGAAGMQLAGPAVVIAPFQNLSGTEAGRLLAGGLTQELITDLMRFKDLRVYSATSNQRWTKDPASFGEELQVA
jgi:adenylate cyclase